jgi:hypothetical protein
MAMEVLREVKVSSLAFAFASMRLASKVPQVQNYLFFNHIKFLYLSSYLRTLNDKNCVLYSAIIIEKRKTFI